MVRIGIDGRTFSVPNPGGAVRTGIELTNNIGKFHTDITVFGHEKAENRLENVQVDSYGYRWNSKSLGMVWEQTALPKRATNVGIDILFSPGSYCPIVPTPFPCAITIHDLSSFRGHSAGWYNRFDRSVIPRMASRADAIFTVSEFSKSTICSELDVPESKVHVIYNGVNKLFFSEVGRNPKDKLPDNYILYVGALSTRKNISGLLQSFQILKENYSIEHDLVLIGPEDDPTNESDVDSQVVEPIKDHIFQLGYVTDEELKQAYSFAEAFVFPSLYEGFGIPPLEAMACGTPVVASNRTAIPEVLQDAALYVDPTNIEAMANTIYRVISDKTLQKTLIEKGYRQSGQYRWENSAETLLKKLCRLAK